VTNSFQEISKDWNDTQQHHLVTDMCMYMYSSDDMKTIFW